jgi:HPt (histidine-containing phosphotransfer) domain-containing protein
MSSAGVAATPPVPSTLVTFFQQEAAEYLDRLDQVISAAGDAPPDLGAFLAHARALRGSAAMARLEGLAELAATVERVGAAIRDEVVHWDQRLQFAVRGALAELRALVERAPEWGEAELRRSRQQSVALGAVAAGYMRTPISVTSNTPPTVPSPGDRIVPIATLFPDDGEAGVAHRAPTPPMTAGQRFRRELAELAQPLVDAIATLRTSSAALRPPALGAVRSAVRAVGAVAESFGAASIVTLTQRITVARLESAAELAALDAFARLLADREIDDAELAARVRSQRAVWGAPSVGGTPAMPSPAVAAPAVPAGRVPMPPTPALPPASPAPAGRDEAPAVRPTPMTSLPPVPLPRSAMLSPVAPLFPVAATPTSPADESDVVPIQVLLLDERTALRRALEVRDALRAAVDRSPSLADPTVRALLDELLDLVALANGRVTTD